jgi:hypothetical protein
MAAVTFDIPDEKYERIKTALDIEGYVYNPENPATDDEQRVAYLKDLTIRYWESVTFNYERQQAINNEPNDSAAEQASRFVPLDDVQAEDLTTINL